MTEKEFEERIAEVKSIRYDSSLAIVDFKGDFDIFQLIGDRRMTEPISEYIGKKVRLFITSQSVWSWEPPEESSPEDES